MLRSFLTVSLRNIFKQRLSSLISSGSLAIGMLFAFVIFKYTAFERSYNRFVPNYENKVRMNFALYNGGELSVSAATSPYPFTTLFRDGAPEIKDYTRVYVDRESLLSFDLTNAVKSDKIVYADETLLDFFGVSLTKGTNIDDNDIRSVVVSEQLAESLFGNQDPIGKVITYSGEHDFTVKGVFSDMPENSSILFDLIIPVQYLQEINPLYFQEGLNWGGYAYQTFYELEEGTSLERLNVKLNELYHNRFDIDPETAEEMFAFDLIHIDEVHLNPQTSRGEDSAISEQKIEMFELLAFIILVIAWVNFINLQSTKAPQRMAEIGLRKVFGANKASLYTLFFSEFLLLNILSLIISAVILYLLQPYLSQWISVNLITDIIPISAHLALFPVLIFGIVFSSAYPALLTLKYAKPIKSTNTSFKESFIQKALVTTQFAVSIFMMAYTLIIYLQVEHMTNQNPGFDTTKVLMINGPLTQSESNRANAEALKQIALGLPGVEVASWSGAVPGVTQGWQGNIRNLNEPRELFQMAYFSNITNDYFEVFDFEILAGRVPQQGTPHEEPRLVVNKKSLSGWGWESPEEAIGKRIEYGSGSTIVAVVEDFNGLGFQNAIDPRVFIVDHLYNAATANNYFTLKLSASQAESTIEALRKSYESIFPGNPFEFSFLDSQFEGLYEDEIAQNKIFSIFSTLAVTLACIGMFGLARYSVQQRRREIGIRKVLGSNEIGLVVLFLKKYISLIIIAFILASPVAYFIISDWLNGFAYQIDLEVPYFLLPLSILSVLTIITVGGISLKAAQSNPVEVLKEH